jgi:hypothetical protein
MARVPSVSKVAKDAWWTKFESDKVRVEIADIRLAQVVGTSRYEVVAVGTPNSFDAEVWRVTDAKSKKAKVFWGETAWSDARRYASDLDFTVVWGMDY